MHPYRRMVAGTRPATDNTNSYKGWGFAISPSPGGESTLKCPMHFRGMWGLNAWGLSVGR